MIKDFIELCKENADISSFVFFDEHQPQASKGEGIEDLHDAFVAIRAVALEIGNTLNADEFLDASIIGTADRFFFRTVSNGRTSMQAVFCSGGRVPLEGLVKTLLERAERAVVEKATVEKALAEKVAAEQAAAERATLEKALAEKIAAEKAAAEKAAAERAAAEKAAAEKTDPKKQKHSGFYRGNPT